MAVQCSVIKYFNMPGLYISIDISTLHSYNASRTKYTMWSQNMKDAISNQASWKYA